MMQLLPFPWHDRTHGGDPAAMMARFPDAPQPWVDLSTGINPYAYPLSPVMAEAWHRLPQPHALEAARSAAARYYGCAADQLLLSAGMQPLMTALAGWRLAMHGAADMTFLYPSYSEPARIWNQLGHRVHATQIPTADGDILWLCAPNNPDARRWASDSIVAWAEQLHARGGWVVVDESFMDCSPENSVLSAAQGKDNIAVLRSCGKFFGVAGMRASVAYVPNNWIEPLRNLLGPWPISTPACEQLIGLWCDISWQQQMRIQLVQESAAWQQWLGTYYRILGAHPLFTLLEHPQAQELSLRLGAAGILVRVFPEHPTWLRIGLPAQEMMPRVQAALRNV